MEDIKIERYTRIHAFGYEVNETWMDVFTTPVEVTSGRPCYDKSKGLKIHRRQSIAAFFSKAFPRPIEVLPSRGAEEEDEEAENPPPSGMSTNAVSAGRGDEKDLVISFMRTVRIPEDKKDYDLPPGLGTFPLFDVASFSERLPLNMVAQGGLFLPMYRRSLVLCPFFAP